ncbi:MAG: non-lysosomal glucosylceramidase [Phycisphaerae bacterium]|nr:non-lysosomal glucosylceramidase [Phycisphaerae bacterium]
MSDNGYRSFTGEQLLQIAMPMGGIGAGCVCLNGHGGLQDFSLRNRPAFSALPPLGFAESEAAFAVLHVRSGRGAYSRPGITRLLEGPMPRGKIYNQGLQAAGFRNGGHEGLPRMAECSFTSSYPFGLVELRDPHVPVAVSVSGFSPFIPLDDRHSSLPCAILEYRLTHAANADGPVDVEFSYHLSHLAVGRGGHRGTRTRVLAGLGVAMSNTEHPRDETFGSAAFGVVGPAATKRSEDGHRPRVLMKGMWFRGGWFDAISCLWRELSGGEFTTNDGTGDRELDGRNGASLLVPAHLEPGQSVTIPVVIAWHFPNGGPVQPPAPDTACDCGGCGCDNGPPAPAWRPYYASQWRDAADVLAHVAANYDSLKSRTRAFADALFSTTAPPELLDAVASNLAILKSPTVLRQENGDLWAWEGCGANVGCCPGSCTHVWNYAQAMPHLFPALERTFRQQEWQRGMDDRGHVNFRATLGDGPVDHSFHAAADGQLGGMLKLYRDWQIAGNREWLERMYPLARRGLEYAIATWDPDQRGALFEPHHNTYDIEFWGPDGMGSSVYLGACAAMAAMADELGLTADADRYDALAQCIAAHMDDELFNGEYYQQNVMWRELRDNSFRKLLDTPSDNAERLQLLRAEGPTYQYGSGCLSDGIIGLWMSDTYGLATPASREHVRSHLKAVFEHNFKRDLWDHACPQRPGYAMGHEAGLLLCTWPRGGKPTLPFVYSDEVWTGIEYQVASHLMNEGLVAEAMTMVAAVRARYDGVTRNPFNEYECGSYYARAMASYALLAAWSGLRYSAVSHTLHLAPKTAHRPFQTFFSTASGFGTVRLDADRRLTIHMIEGTLPLTAIHVRDGEKDYHATPNTTATAGKETVVTLT